MVTNGTVISGLRLGGGGSRGGHVMAAAQEEPFLDAMPQKYGAGHGQDNRNGEKEPG